jgi:hypothetical protein
MSNPLATIFHGDVTLEIGSDVTQFGYGDLNVNRTCVINGTQDSTTNTDGSLIVYGGVGIAKSVNIHKDLNVQYGITKLTETHIDTNNGPFQVSGGNTVNINVGPSSQFISTGGNLNLSSEIGILQLYGGVNSNSSVDIRATNNDGGIRLLSGISTGEISLISGSGGIKETTSNGNILLTANNGSGSFIVNTTQPNQDLLLSLTGSSDSQLRIESAGNNLSKSALVINTSSSNGNIVISNFDGLGNGSLTQNVGSGGFSMVTNTAGPINFISQAAPTRFDVNSANNNQNLTLSLNNPTDSSLVIQSQGINSAIEIKTLNTAGNIFISQENFSNGKIDILSGSGGFITTTRTGGSIVMTTNSAISTYTNSTTSDNQDLNITVTGNTNSKVNIASSGTGNDAITLSANNGGGVFITANGPVSLESDDQNNGVKIATSTLNTPVFIGTPSSTTTVYGNLDVKGITTTIESTVVTVDDNIIIVNNAPSGTSDGGLAIKRYQSANDVGTGDVINDTADESGIVQNGGNDPTHVHLSSSASNINNYYAGWWIKITSGTGSNQVRRIKEYDNVTKIATIYSTIEQTGILNNPVPVEGMDFATTPDITSNYALHPCHYVMAIWDESYDEFSLVCSNQNPAVTTSIAHYSNLHINNLTSNAITTNTINGSDADTTIIVTLDNNSTNPVVMTNYPKNYGVYLIFVRPLNESDTNRTHAIFMIGRLGVSTVPGTVVRLISVKGVYNDQLDIQWPANQKPQLLYRPYPNGIGGSTDYKIKIVYL